MDGLTKWLNVGVTDALKEKRDKKGQDRLC